MLAIVDLEERVSQDHPLWRFKAVADPALERLLKACLLIALYSVRSERAFGEDPGTTCPVAGSWTWT